MIARAFNSALADLKVKIIQFSFSGTLPRSFILEFGLKLTEFGLKTPLLTVKLFDLLFKFFFVGACDVEPLNRLLDVMDTTAFLFFKYLSFFLKSLRAGTSMCFNSFLIILIDAKLGQFKLSFFVLSDKGKLLRFTFELSLILLDKRIFILL